MISAWAALTAAQHGIIQAILALAGICGLIAVASPARFKTLAELGGRWIDTNRIAQRLDQRYDIDRYALRYPRAFGLAVLAASAFLAVIVCGK